MAMSVLGSRKPSFGTWLAISVLCGLNGLRNQPTHVVGSPFPAFKACFSAIAGIAQET